MFQRTCVFKVDFLFENEERIRCGYISIDLILWFQKQTENFGEYHNIHQIYFDRSIHDPSLMTVSYRYSNVDPEWDEGKMSAQLLIDPDDDGNCPLDGKLIRGTIVELTEAIEITDQNIATIGGDIIYNY